MEMVSLLTNKKKPSENAGVPVEKENKRIKVSFVLDKNNNPVIIIH